MSRPGPGNTPGAPAADTAGAGAAQSARRVSFRLPAWALLLPVIAFLCAIPLVTAGGFFVWLGFGIPALVLVSTLLTRTTADARRITVTGPWRRRTIAWSDLDTLEFTGTRWAVAVTAAGKRIRLIMVRPKDLPALTAVAGGELLLAEDQEVAAEQDRSAEDDAAPEPAAPEVVGDAADGTGAGLGPTTAPDEHTAADSPGRDVDGSGTAPR